MKTYIITEDERIDLYEMALRGQHRRIAAALKMLAERIPELAHALKGNAPDSQPDPNQACDCDCPRSYDESNRCTVCGKPPAHVIPHPEAPKDWSGHPEYGECRRCEHERVDADKDPCRACCLEYRETGQSPYWQPRTP